MENQILAFILIGTIIIFILLGSILYIDSQNTKKVLKRENEVELEKKQLIIDKANEVMKTIEEERMRMAYSFHDTVVPMLVNLKHSLYFIEPFLDDKQAFNQANRSKELINEIIDHQRSIIQNLAPRTLYISGLKDAFSEYLNSIVKFQVNFTNEDDQSLPLECQSNFNVYSILMELVNNIVKYEKIDCLNAHLSIHQGVIQFILQHNGVGLSSEDFNDFAVKKKSYGITSIKRRIDFLNGNIEFVQQAGGAVILLTIPKQYV